jgi:hypothetical protein
MTAINFPDSPSNGDTHVVGGVTYTYDSTETKWKTTINSNAFLPLTGGTVSGNIVLGGEIQHSGDTDTKLHFDPDTIKFDTAGSERARIDSSGRLLVGASTALNIGGSAGTAAIQNSATTTACHISLSRFSANSSAPFLEFGKSRGASVGTQTIAANSDQIGTLQFSASDGVAFIEAARIRAEVDGTPGTNDMPGRLVFSTTADGASSPTERMRLTSTGDLRFNSGYGSVATAYGVRAWANINGTGTIAIRNSGNISSITDHGAGQYTFTFTNNLPDANYSFVLTGNEGTPNNGSIVSAPAQSANSTSSIRVDCVNNGGTRIDMQFLSLVIVR